MGLGQSLNVVLSVTIAVVAAVATVVVTRPALLQRAAERRADWVGLPLGSEAITAAVTARLRSFALVTGIVLTVGAGAAAVVAFGPAGDDLHLLMLTVALAFVAIAAGTTVVTVSRPLFRPAADTPRVARAASRKVSDYLGRLRRSLPWVLTLLSAIWVGVLVVRGEAAVPGVVLTALGVVALLLLPVVDRSVLTAPQAASDSLELAWDDAFRADALGTARVTVCLVALAGALLAQSPAASWTAAAINLAMTAVVVLYARSPLEAALRGPWLAAGMAGRR